MPTIREEQLITALLDTLDKEMASLEEGIDALESTLEMARLHIIRLKSMEAPKSNNNFKLIDLNKRREEKET